MNNREVAHLWAAQSRPSAKGSSFYFEGPTVYSYGAHFPVATIYQNAKRHSAPPFVLFNSGSYSVTTARHQSYARAAARHLPSASVPYPQAGDKSSPDAGRHSDNIAYLTRTLAECAAQAGRRTRERAVTWDAERAASVHRGLVDYLIFFKIKRKAPPMPGFAAAFERARRIENPDPASKDKRERAKAARNAARAVREAKARELEALHIGAARTNWRLNGAFMGAQFAGYAIHSPVMLRVDADEIVTSMGARVPLAAAPMVWNLVERARTNGAETTLFSKRYRIGDYPLDRIDADGTLHAGCHTIPHSELASMARALGLAS